MRGHPAASDRPHPVLDGAHIPAERCVPRAGPRRCRARGDMFRHGRRPATQTRSQAGARRRIAIHRRKKPGARQHDRLIQAGHAWPDCPMPVTTPPRGNTQIRPAARRETANQVHSPLSAPKVLYARSWRGERFLLSADVTADKWRRLGHSLLVVTKTICAWRKAAERGREHARQA